MALSVATSPVHVGQLDLHNPVQPVQAARIFASALLLVTVDGVPAGQVTVPLVDGYASARTILEAVHDELGSDVRAAPPLRSVGRALTVVVATRSRSVSLGRCLRSLLRSEHPRLSVLVVDNDPDDADTAAAVEALDDPRVGYVLERRRGTSVARNRGLAEARERGAELVAFVDDDVEVDPGWAGRMAAALSQPGVACVCGPVMAAHLESPAQIAADAALGWQKGFARRRFSLAEPPEDSPIFPFSPGLYGVGANMGVNAAVATELGGFDPALGPGTAAMAGEDCEFMVRLVLAGHALAYEPSAYLWHHHRPSDDALAGQLDGYAVGLGGYLAKIMLDPVGRAAALRRVPAALRRLRSIREREASGSSGSNPLRTLVSGPVAYVMARHAVRRAGGTVPPLVASHEQGAQLRP
jgi:GT2 family glycosyltransferase